LLKSLSRLRCLTLLLPPPHYIFLPSPPPPSFLSLAARPFFRTLPVLLAATGQRPCSFRVRRQMIQDEWQRMLLLAPYPSSKPFPFAPPPSLLFKSPPLFLRLALLSPILFASYFREGWLVLPFYFSPPNPFFLSFLFLRCPFTVQVSSSVAGVLSSFSDSGMMAHSHVILYVL